MAQIFPSIYGEAGMEMIAPVVNRKHSIRML